MSEGLWSARGFTLVRLEDIVNSIRRPKLCKWMTAVEDHRELTQRLSPQVVLLLSPLCLLRCCLRPEAEALARFIDLTATHCDPTLIH
jgi:hypothetical protein